jgi:hypothetical protein
MNAVSTDLATSLQAETVRCLADGVDTQKIDDYLDRLFEWATAYGSVACSMSKDDLLCVQTLKHVSHEFHLPRAKSKLRIMCARLAVRCEEWSKRKVSPYGDALEIEFPANHQRYAVRFENSTAAQDLTIETVAAGQDLNGR